MTLLGVIKSENEPPLCPGEAIEPTSVDRRARRHRVGVARRIRRRGLGKDVERPAPGRA